MSRAKRAHIRRRRKPSEASAYSPVSTLAERSERTLRSAQVASDECAHASLGSFRLRRMCACFARLMSPPANVRSLCSAHVASGEGALASLGSYRLRRTCACFARLISPPANVRMCARFARLISPPAYARSLRSAHIASGICALASLGSCRLRRTCEHSLEVT